MMRWALSHRFDPGAVAIADRHYSRQKVGSPQFVAPGSNVVLRIGCLAVWVSRLTAWPKHAWPGAWECPMFRNEGAGLSSELIREAVAATAWAWGPMPPEGMITFVNPRKVRAKRDPGRCFLRAGFVAVGCTLSRLLVLRLGPESAPPPDASRGRAVRPLRSDGMSALLAAGMDSALGNGYGFCTPGGTHGEEAGTQAERLLLRRGVADRREGREEGWNGARHLSEAGDPLRRPPRRDAPNQDHAHGRVAPRGCASVAHPLTHLSCTTFRTLSRTPFGNRARYSPPVSGGTTPLRLFSRVYRGVYAAHTLLGTWS